MIVSNTSPLIVFGKQGILDVFRHFFKEIAVPSGVYYEVLQKKESIEAHALEKARSEGWIKVHEIEIHPLLNVEPLGDGEKEAISLAYRLKCSVLMDDDLARSYAALLKVGAHGSLYLLYQACLKKYFTKARVIEILERMIAEGFYVSTEVYAAFIKTLDEH